MSLKVFDLQCEQGHVFEGWFASAEAYESQKGAGLLSCPVCNSSEVSRKVSAARLNIGHLRRERLESPAAAAAAAVSGSGEPVAAVSQPAVPQAAELARIQGEVIRHIRKVLSQTENVGNRFAEESRRIHYGDSDPRAIRGVATREEVEELVEEGIGVVPIPDVFDDDRLQ